MREGDLVERFGRTGLQGITGGTLETSVDYADFDDYWEPFTGAAGPATGAFYASLDPAGKAPLRDTVRASCRRARSRCRRAPGSRWEPFRAKARTLRRRSEWTRSDGSPWRGGRRPASFVLLAVRLPVANKDASACC